MKKSIDQIISILLFVVVLIPFNVEAQSTDSLIWHVPLPEHIEGRGWNDTEELLDRLPLQLKERVREPVWDLSKNSAGLVIQFFTDAPEVVVEYVVKGNLQMSHMPATGVSGLDLYAISHDGNWMYCAGKRAMQSDSIKYTFNNLEIHSSYHNKGREYWLFLPLYNQVVDLKIGISKESNLRFLEKRKERPIVVYGTSITQGGCASRPGNAWTNILMRAMDRPVYNLGFSGNGRLEEEIINLMVEEDAAVYVLDCLPNLPTKLDEDSVETRKKIVRSIEILKEKKPDIPILLVDHPGFSDELINENSREDYLKKNEILNEVLNEMTKGGVKGLYHLNKEELNLSMDATVDGIHTNDLGMHEYARSYEQKLREILLEPKGEIITQKPVIQWRDYQLYDWKKRHDYLLDQKLNQSGKVNVVIGNSIIHFFGGNDSDINRGGKSWSKYMDKNEILNLSYGWDRIENVLWRIYHDELEGLDIDHLFLLIGTNNLGINTNEEILQGITFLVEAIKKRQPEAKITLIGILPRKDHEERIKILNQEVEKVSKNLNGTFIDFGSEFLNESGKIEEKYFSDGLHPSEVGYKLLGKSFDTYIKGLRK